MKRMMKYCLMLLATTFSAAFAAAQQPHCSFLSFDDFIETLIDEQEEGDDITSWLEDLQVLFENPLNINTASKDNLLRIPFLNELTVNNIIEYRQKTGGFFSFYELTSVEGVGRELAEKIACFVQVGEPGETGDESPVYKQKPRHQLLMKGWQSFPKQAGYISTDEKPAPYQGGPAKIYARYVVQQGDRFQAGFTADRDPGEPFFKANNKQGFDFYSAHLKLKINRWIPQVVIGDFSARAGQGLILWQGFSLGKSAEVLSVSKGTTQIRPYTSSDENFFFRGVATSLQKENARLHIFVSRKKSDGNIVIDNDGNTTFSSLQTSGYHRTLSEIDDKNSVRHTVAGAIFNYSFDRLKVGANFLYEHFQYPFVRSGQLYQEFLFSGQQNYNVGFDYRFISGRYQFYGEAAVSRSGGFALLQGIDARLHDQFNVTMLFRHYEKDYHATWGNGFGEGGNTANETGFYAGFKILPVPKVAISAYADWFQSPWLNYATIGPTSGHDFLVHADIRPTRKLTGYIRLKTKTKESKTKAENLYFDEAEKRTNLRFHAKYQISNSFALKTRAESVWYDYLEKESGILVFQDVVWNPPRLPFNAAFRFSWFKTDSYNSRIYAYEDDLLYNFSTLAFYGEGIRTYLNLKFSISEKINAWLKIANTAYFDRDSISSGYSLIEGNKKTDIKVQLRYKF